MRITVLTFAPFSVFVIAAFFAKLNEFKEISRYWLIYMAGVAIAGFIAYREICMPSTAQDYQQLGDLFNIFLLGTSAYATALNLNTEMHGWAGIAIFHAVCLMLIAPVYFNAVKTKPRQLAGESDSAVPAIQP
jgi:hypothetical protein